METPPDIATDAPRIEVKHGLFGPMLSNKSWKKVGSRYMRLADNGEHLEIYYAGWVVNCEGEESDGFDTLGAAKSAAEGY